MFIPSDLKINSDMIGCFSKKTLTCEKIKEILRKGKYVKSIDLNINPYSICSLPNATLLCCSSSNINIFDKKLQLVKTVSNIDGQPISSLTATTNERDRIYLTDYRYHRVIMTDLDLNKIKTTGALGTGPNQYNNPYGIAFYKGNIYVCDYGNKRVQKLTENLDYIRLYPLDFCPLQVKVANDNLLIRSNSESTIRLYDIETFTLKQKYDGHNGYISEINSNFYEYYSANRKLYFYDQNGSLNDEFQSNGFLNLFTGIYDGCIVILDGNLLLSSYSSKKIIQLEQS